MSRFVLSSSKKHAEASLQNFRRFGSPKRFFTSTYSRSTQSKISPHPLTEQTMMGYLEGLKCIKKHGSVRRYCSSSCESRNGYKPPSLPEQATAPNSCRSLEKLMKEVKMSQEQYFRALDHSIETLKKEMDILQTELRTLKKTLDETRDVREITQSKTQLDVLDKKYEIMTGLMGHVTFYALAIRVWF